MTDLTRLPASELAAQLAAGEISSVEATQAHLDRIQGVDADVHAFLHVNTEEALATAADVDRRRAAGEQLGQLAGVPVAVKDVLTTKGQPTTSGSRILEGWNPPYDATAVEHLRQHDTVIIGKTNMDEFAMGSTTEHSAYGPTHNPWSLDRIPGGSGGGSAAAVAAFEAPLALGSDTGGSIRQPAALTGTVGVKPTYGGVSRWGAIALASSLDQIGPVARNVLDTALIHDVIKGHDPKDSTSLTTEWPSFAAAARRGQTGESLKGLRVGIIRELNQPGFQVGVRSRFDETVALLTAQGAEVVEVSAPHFEYAVSAYYLVLPAEASSNLAKFDGVRYGLRVLPEGVKPTVENMMAATREAGFGPEVKRRIVLGTYALSAGYYDQFYGKAQKVRTLIQRDFEAAFNEADVLISPTSPTTAYPLGDKLSDPLAMYLADITTIPANLAGIPAISQPIGLAAEDGLPVGLQTFAPAFEDARLYEFAGAVETLLEQQWGGPIIDQAPQLAVRSGAQGGAATDATAHDSEGAAR